MGRISSVYIIRGNESGFLALKHLLCVSQSVTWWKERTMWRWTEKYSRSLLLRSPSALRTTTSTSTTPPQLVEAARDSSERSKLVVSLFVFKMYIKVENGNKSQTYNIRPPWFTVVIMINLSNQLILFVTVVKTNRSLKVSQTVSYSDPPPLHLFTLIYGFDSSGFDLNLLLD